MKSTCPLYIALALALSFGVSQLSAQQTKQVLKEDVLVFRVQNRQVFLSNLKSYLKHLKDLHCLFPESRLLKISGMSYEEVLATKDQSVSDVQKSSERPKLLMRLILAQVYTNSLELSLDRDFDLQLSLQKCGLGRFGSWNNELKSLVQAELYMRKGTERPTEFNAKAVKRYQEKIDEKMDYEFYL